MDIEPLALVVPTSPAIAGGVVSVCDEAHLLAALAGGGTVTFSCSGTITLIAEIAIAADTTIDGSGQTVTTSGNHAVRVFKVNSGITFNLNELIIANGAVPYASTGGGILNDGTVIVGNSTFFGNSAERNGGGISNSSDGTVDVNNCIFSGNNGGSGGGIYNGGTLTVSNSTFSGNSAADFQGGGGGILNDGTLNVSNTTFSDNSADQQGVGGAIDNDATLIVSNCTFSGNTADYGAGGAIITGGYPGHGVMTVSNSTFSGNRAYAAGGIYLYAGTATLKNTIVANNWPGGNCRGNTITDGGGNLSYPGTACPGINGDPMLGSLRDNGGPTETMALGPGSAAIDAGIDATCAIDPVNNLDQRGATRPQGRHCDIGAVEQEPYMATWLPSARVQ